MEALSWGGESSRPRLPGSASSSTGRVTAVVEWSNLVEKGEDEWPNSPQEERNETQQEIEQEATGKVVNVSLAVAVNRKFEWNIERISSWNRLLRRTAWIFRFINRCRKKKRDPVIGFTKTITIKNHNKNKSQRKPDKTVTIARMSEEELDEAELFIFRQLQMETYPKAFKNLQLEGPIHPKER